MLRSLILIAAAAAALVCNPCRAQISNAPAWIWARAEIDGSPPGDVLFRLDFELPEVVDAWLWITVDNGFTADLNGIRIAAGEDWQKPQDIVISEHLSPGSNSLLVRARNTGREAGLLASVLALTLEGDERVWVSGPDWLAAVVTEGSDAPGVWEPVRVQGTAPCAPWTGVSVPSALLSMTSETTRISPNGDGLQDQSRIRVSYPPAGRDTTLTFRARSREGVLVTRLSLPPVPDQEILWPPLAVSLADGEYDLTIEAESGTGPGRSRTLTLRAQSPVFLRPAADRMHEVFPIGVWYDGRVEGINCPEGYTNVPQPLDEARVYYRRTFRDIRAHGIEYIAIPNTPPGYRGLLLEEADDARVKVVLEVAELAWPEFGGELSVRSPDMIDEESRLLPRVRDLIRPLRAHPSLFAYQLIDEPSADLAARWQLLARVLEHLDPSRPPFSCLCNEHELHRTTRMGMQMLVFDRYVLGRDSVPGAYDFRQWCGLMSRLAGEAAGAEIPWWMVVQACGSDHAFRLPEISEVSTMVHTALARGATGIWFFLYNSRTQQESLHGLVDTDLSPSPLWEALPGLVDEIAERRDFLLSASPAGEGSARADNPAVDLSFLDSPQGRTLYLTNLDVTAAQSAVVTVEATPGERLMRLFPRTEAVTPALADSAPLRVSLPPGGSAVWLLTREQDKRD